MNADILEGKWKQMRGQVKEWWGNGPTTTWIGRKARRPVGRPAPRKVWLQPRESRRGIQPAAERG